MVSHRNLPCMKFLEVTRYNYGFCDLGVEIPQWGIIKETPHKAHKLIIVHD